MSIKTINPIEGNDNVICTVLSYDASKQNALKHGILSKYTVMQWENRDDYDSLLNSLVREYQPEGATEEHLVEELVGIMWRKMRLRYTEMTSIQSSLSKNIERDSSYLDNESAKDALLAPSSAVENFDIRQAVTYTDAKTQEFLIQTKEKLDCCLVAEQTLEETNSYQNGLAALHEEDQNKWQEDWDNDDENDISSATAEGLLSWINDLRERYEARIYELKNRQKVKQQILGKSFLSDKELDKYSRYETHLDRKFEKTLAMLIKLQDLRESQKNSLTSINPFGKS